MRDRAALVVLAAASVAACAPEFPPYAGGAVAPAFEDGAFTAADGARLKLRHWPAIGDEIAVIVALHGVTDHSTFVEGAAAFWAARGVTTYAYDQRGHGGNADWGLWPGDEAIVADVASAVAAARAARPDTPVFLLGSSMGGAAALAAVGEGRVRPDGLILVAPATWGWSQMPFIYGWPLRAAAAVTPAKALTGESAGRAPSDNMFALRALASDPKTWKATRIDAVYGLVDLMERGLDAAPRIGAPSLLLYGGQDEIVPTSATRSLADALSNEDAIYESAGHHLLLRDKAGPYRWRTILGWIHQQIANFS